jgi:hypothetical protein
MSKLKGFILSCALVLMAGTASSQMALEFTDATGSTIIPNNHIQSISIDHVNNVINITTSEDYTVELAADPCTVDCGEVAPTITTFSVVSPITVGGSTTVNWSATANATSCETSGNYSGWTALSIGTSSSGTPVPMNTVGNYTFSLTCFNGGLASTTVNSTVVVEDDVIIDPQSSCPSDYTSSLAGISIPWENFWDADFPFPGYANEYATIARTGYYAIEFDTGNIGDTGSLQTIESTTTSGIRLGSVSTCKGDFDVPQECQFVWGTSGGIVWSTENYSGACQLEPNTTYYFNLTFTDGFNSDTSSCADAKCITKVRVYNP